MSLNFKGELCVLTIKNDAKFEIELAYYFRNSRNCDPSTQKSQKCAL